MPRKKRIILDDDDWDDEADGADEYDEDDEADEAEIDDWDARSRWGWGGYRPTIAAKGGIRAQSQRGAFGQSWWAKRWIAVLEDFDLGARLTRGRSYARSGQVLSIKIEKGNVKARVQGSYPQPYRVEIQIKPLSEANWERLTASLSTQVIFAAKLLAGEMPQEIEEAFNAAGLSLLPKRLGDLTTDCSCPDWSNPCKHIAAVYYLLGEEFDRDPFLIFKLRGMEREEFIERLGQVASISTSAAEKEETQHKPEPLVADASNFWQGNPISADLFGAVPELAGAAALPKRLGKFPFWRGQEPLIDTLTPIYERAANHAVDVFVGIRDEE
jgi:uncharacterized Zn finger protein